MCGIDIDATVSTHVNPGLANSRRRKRFHLILQDKVWQAYRWFLRNKLAAGTLEEHAGLLVVQASRLHGREPARRENDALLKSENLLGETKVYY